MGRGHGHGQTPINVLYHKLGARPQAPEGLTFSQQLKSNLWLGNAGLAFCRDFCPGANRARKNFNPDLSEHLPAAGGQHLQVLKQLQQVQDLEAVFLDGVIGSRQRFSVSLADHEQKLTFASPRVEYLERLFTWYNQPEPSFQWSSSEQCPQALLAWAEDIKEVVAVLFPEKRR